MDPVSSAIRFGNIQNLLNILKTVHLSQEDKEQALLYATSLHQYAIVDQLLDSLEKSPTYTYPYHQTQQAFFIAADNGDLKMIDIFLHKRLNGLISPLLESLIARYAKVNEETKTNIFKVFDHILKTYPYDDNPYTGASLLEDATKFDTRRLFVRLLSEPISETAKYYALGAIKAKIRPTNLRDFTGYRPGKKFKKMKTWQIAALAIYDPYFNEKSEFLQEEMFASRYPELDFDQAFNDAPGEVLDDADKAINWLEDKVAAELGITLVW